MEKENFEDSLKNVFNQAEANPSETVWTNIELDLEKAESGRMKRSLLFFKMLAAASVVFAMGVSSTVFYMTQQSTNNTLSQTVTHQNQNKAIEAPLSDKVSDLAVKENEKNSNAVTQKNKSESEQSNPREQNTALTYSEEGAQEANHTAAIEKADLNSKPDVNLGTDRSGTKQRNSQINNAQGKKGERSVMTSPYSTIASHTNESSTHQQESSTAAWETADASAILLPNSKTLPVLVKTQKAGIILPKEEAADPVALMLARLDQEEKQVRASAEKKDRKKNAKEEKLWTSVGFAAGSFNSLNSGVSPQTSNMVLARNSQIADNEANASGMAYSVGVNMGAKISNRWVLQGGVNYMTQSSDYTAQAAVGAANFQSFRPASVVELNKFNDEGAQNAQQDKLVATAPYNVNNNVQYLSLPLQAGYMIINKKFGLQLNAGVATDLFLQNTKSTDSDNFDKVTQGRGADSPYRPLNFSGLAGTELSYRFGSRYRLALNPGVRYPFRSIYKSESGVQSTPLTFDVGLRFRYIFQ